MANAEALTSFTMATTIQAVPSTSVKIVVRAESFAPKGRRPKWIGMPLKGPIRNGTVTVPQAGYSVSAT